MRWFLAFLVLAALAATLLLRDGADAERIVASPAALAGFDRRPVPLDPSGSGMPALAPTEASTVDAVLGRPFVRWIGRPVLPNGEPVRIAAGWVEGLDIDVLEREGELEPDHALYQALHYGLPLPRGSVGPVVWNADLDREGRFVADLPVGYHLFRVRGTQRRHIKANLDVRPELAVVDESGMPVLRTDVVLWPEGWAAALIRAEGPHTIGALAEEFDATAEQFSRAFRVLVSRELELGPQDWPSLGTPEAIFHAAPLGWDSSQSVAIVGAIEFKEARPFDIGLWLGGFVVSTEPEASGTCFEDGDGVHSYTFPLSASSLGEHVGEIAAHHWRVRGASGPAQVAPPWLTQRWGAGSGPNSEQLNGLARGALGGDGRVHRRASPGSATNQDARPLVAPSEARGPLTEDDFLDAGPGITIRVVTERGMRVKAFVEVAAYEPGARERDLYPKAARRRTDRSGTFVLGVPTRPIVVRARRRERNAGAPASWPGTPSVLIDPAAGVRQIELVLRPEQAVEFDLGSVWQEGDRITIEDELGLVVASPDPGRHASVSLHLGRYLTRRYRGDLEIGSRVSVVDGETSRLSVP